MTRVLALGHRAGAPAAAEALGVELAVLAERPPAEDVGARVALGAPVVFRDEAGVVAAARALFPGEPPAAVVALVEGSVTAAAAVREALGVPGTSREVALRCCDKLAMKRAARAAGVPTARWVATAEERDPDALVERLGLPIVLKRARSSGSRGLVVARDRAALVAALAGGNGAEVPELAEGFVDGREMSVESFVADGEVLFENPTEYLVPLHANVVPAELDPGTWDAVRALSRSAIAALGVTRGMTHVELFLTRAGPVFGELALRPPGGRLMRLLRSAYALDPWQALLEVELGGRPELPDRPRRAAGTWILHPGEGTVAAIEGLGAARAVPGVRRVLLRIEPGARVARRIGSGQDVGYIDARGTTRDDVARALREAHERLRIELE